MTQLKNLSSLSRMRVDASARLHGSCAINLTYLNLLKD